jgi:hypothetical protein
VVERFVEAFSRDEHKDRNQQGSVRRRAESFN